MQDVLSLPDGKCWYLLESQDEASDEGLAMANAMGMNFLRESGRLARLYRETTNPDFRTRSGEDLFVRRNLPLFFSLRDGAGRRLVSGMLPRGVAPGEVQFLASGNHDPYVEHAAAIVELGKLYGFDLTAGKGYPTGYPYDNFRGKPAASADRLPQTELAAG